VKLPYVLITVGLCSLLAAGQLQAQKKFKRGRVPKDDDAPKVGQMAPAFKLKSLDGKSDTELASFKGKRPVVLFFGSYT